MNRDSPFTKPSIAILPFEAARSKRDSAAYVLRKQLKRYKLPLTIGAAFVLVITVGFVASHP